MSREPRDADHYTRVDRRTELAQSFELQAGVQHAGRWDHGEVIQVIDELMEQVSRLTARLDDMDESNDKLLGQIIDLSNGGSYLP